MSGKIKKSQLSKEDKEIQTLEEKKKKWLNILERIFVNIVQVSN